MLKFVRIVPTYFICRQRLTKGGFSKAEHTLELPIFAFTIIRLYLYSARNLTTLHKLCYSHTHGKAHLQY